MWRRIEDWSVCLVGIKASPEQDLLSFHTIGQTDYKQYVDYCILRIHANKRSTKAKTPDHIFNKTKGA